MKAELACTQYTACRMVAQKRTAKIAPQAPGGQSIYELSERACQDLTFHLYLGTAVRTVLLYTRGHAS